jgi:hypothetical protein
MVGIAPGHELDDRQVRVLVPVGWRIFTSLHIVHTCSGVRPAYPMGTRGKAAGVVYCQKKKRQKWIRGQNAVLFVVKKIGASCYYYYVKGQHRNTIRIWNCHSCVIVTALSRRRRTVPLATVITSTRLYDRSTAILSYMCAVHSCTIITNLDVMCTFQHNCVWH